MGLEPTRPFGTRLKVWCCNQFSIEEIYNASGRPIYFKERHLPAMASHTRDEFCSRYGFTTSHQRPVLLTMNWQELGKFVQQTLRESRRLYRQPAETDGCSDNLLKHARLTSVS